MAIKNALLDPFKDTINAFKNVGSGAYDAAKNAAKPAIDATKPYADKVLARLGNIPKPTVSKAIGGAGMFAVATDNAMKGIEAIDNMKNNGINLKDASNSLSLAGAHPVMAAPVFLGNLGAAGIAKASEMYGNYRYGGDGLTPASRAFAKTLQYDENGKIIPPPTPQENEQQRINDTAAFLEKDAQAKVPKLMVENQKRNQQLQQQANQEMLVSIGGQAPQQPVVEPKVDPYADIKASLLQGGGEQVNSASDNAQSQLDAIRETLAMAQDERAGIVNPLEQQSNMKLKNYKNNPFAAVMQLQNAISEAQKVAVGNKLANNNAKALTDQAKSEADLVQLGNTLQNSELSRAQTGQNMANDNIKLANDLDNSALRRELDATNADTAKQQLSETIANNALNREKVGIDVEEGKMKLEQTKRVSDAMKQLSALDDNADPDGSKRKALQQNILTMLGKEANNDFEIKEIGGGNDPITNIPLPKQVVVFNKKTGQIVSGGGGGEQQAKAQASKYKVGDILNLPDGRVFKAVGFDDKGNPKWDDNV